MYAIICLHTDKVLRSWSYLATSDDATTLVRRTRDEMAASDGLVVLCTPPETAAERDVRMGREPAVTMLKPSDLAELPSHCGLDPDNMVALEAQFNAAIRDAHARDYWPARVGSHRDTITGAEVAEMARRYRAMGWDVETPNRQEDWVALIRKPAPSQSTNVS
jgi:hypothetical protein